MTDNLAGNNIYNNTPYGNLGYDNTANIYRYAEDNSAIINVDSLNKNCETVNINGTNYLCNGQYKIGTQGRCFYFDKNGNM